MKRLLFALPLVISLFLACSADFGVGPDEGERALVPAEETCNRNVQIC
jgi:hypothetical protein